MKNCPNCNKELREEAKFCSGCGYKFLMENNTFSCPQCGNPLRAGAKFCGKCGTKLQAQTDIINPGNEFAVPGATVLTTREAPVHADISAKEFLTTMGGFLRWNILQGQLAVKIDEETLYTYGDKVKGIDIQEGVKALLFINGKFSGELGSGHYPFAEWKNQLPAENNPGFLQRIIRASWTGFMGFFNKDKAEEMRRDNAKVPFSFVLIRTNEFPLIYEFADIPTATVSCNIGIHLLFKIANINEFYANHLLKQKYVSFESMSNYREFVQSLKTQLGSAFTQINPEQIILTPEISQLLQQKLQSLILGIFPYIQLTRILNVSAQNKDLDNFRRMAEELYVSERELVELTKRNDFLNRMQIATNEQEITRLKMDYAHENSVTDINQSQEELAARRDSMHDVAMQSIANAQELTELRMSTAQDVEASKIEAQFAADKEKIYEEMALTEDERAKFDLMLSAQKKLREAKSEEEIAVAMQEFRKSGLLREQEIEALQHQIAHNAQLRDLNDAQVLSMATMQNQIALDQQKLEWEIQIGNKRIQNQFDRQRIEDAYHDEKRDKEYNFTDQRREKDADFSDRRRDADAAYEDRRRNADAVYEDSRRRSNIDLDRQEQENQLDMLQKAQAIRQQREAAEHQREMEAAEAARRHELDTQRLAQEAEKAKLDAANEEKRIYAGMTFEQIMAANPNLTPQAAQALAKKYEAEAEAAKAQAAMAQNDKTAQMAIDQQNQMMAFMQQQMAMMKDISMAGINAGATHQQAMLDAKQAELDRTRTDASANSDRFVDGMKTTINAVSNMNRPMQCQPQNVLPPQAPQTVVQATPVPMTKQMIKCPKCNSEITAGEAFCSECGESL